MHSTQPNGYLVEPIPGDPDTLEQHAQQVRDHATLLEDAGKLLQHFSNGTVTGLDGKYVKRIASRCYDSAELLVQSAAFYTHLCDAIVTYASALRSHQSDVLGIIGELDEYDVEVARIAESLSVRQSTIDELDEDNPIRKELEAEVETLSARSNELGEVRLDILARADAIFVNFQSDYDTACDAVAQARELPGGDSFVDNLSEFLSGTQDVLGAVDDVLDWATLAALLPPFTALAGPIGLVGGIVGGTNFVVSVVDSGVDIARNDFTIDHLENLFVGIAGIVPLPVKGPVRTFVDKKQQDRDIAENNFIEGAYQDIIALPYQFICDIFKVVAVPPDPTDDWRKALEEE